MQNITVKITKGRQLKAYLKSGIQGPQGADGLQGEQGIAGQNGRDGNNGLDGRSAYQSALENGFTGTEQEWLLSLKGDKGDSGDQGIQGEQGEQGVQGIKGDKGDTGEQGVAGPNLVSSSTSTNLTGIIKGNGTNIEQAQAKIDFQTPLSSQQLSIIAFSTLNTL